VTPGKPVELTLAPGSSSDARPPAARRGDRRGEASDRGVTQHVPVQEDGRFRSSGFRWGDVKVSGGARLSELEDVPAGSKACLTDAIPAR
jgi:hypothetical protein